MGGFMSPTHTVTDIDGNEYKTVKIGTQIWMAENLRTATYNDGTSIPNVTDGSTWSGLTSGAWCYYDNNSSYNIPYGKLYNGYTIDNGKLCPTGWDVPTLNEFDTLYNYLGGGLVAGIKLRNSETVYWVSTNTGTNIVGFNLVGGGRRASNGTFYNFQSNAYLYSSTIDDGASNWLYYTYTFNNSDAIYLTTQSKNSGYAIRCIKN
jgi:uncharacterized protein (TIGR02145 family)